MTSHCAPGDRRTAREVSELIATAIANAEGSAELGASRRRIVAAADEARRRIERDLHDGIQQRLIALTFRARAMVRRSPDELPGLSAELAEGLKEVSDELREVARGIHPTILTEAGLGPALRALARRSNVPIDVDVNSTSGCRRHRGGCLLHRLRGAHERREARAGELVELIASHDGAVLMLEVRDDGIGGVDADGGSGIRRERSWGISSKPTQRHTSRVTSTSEQPPEGTAISSRGHAVAVVGCRSGDGSAEARSTSCREAGRVCSPTAPSV